MSTTRLGTMEVAPEVARGVEVGRILVIDDEPIIRDVLGEILSREGYAISSVPDAETGLAALERQEYDLIILDLMLPELTTTNASSGRPDLRWIAWATSSLPVPLSPWINTVDRLGATCSINR